MFKISIKLKILMLLCILFILNSCSSDSSEKIDIIHHENKENSKDIFWDEEMTPEYILSEKLCENLKLDLFEREKATGLIMFDENFLLTDLNNNRLVLFDKSGNLITEKGNIGNGKLEFDAPTAVAKDDDNNIYILESGNFRIQILNSKFEFKEEIDLKDIFASVLKDEMYFSRCSFWSILLDSKGGIYFSLADAWQGAESKVYYISPDRKTYKGIGSYLGGILLINDDILYVIERSEYIKRLNGSTEEISTPNGKNNLVKIVDGIVTDTYELPEMARASGAFIKDDELYIAYAYKSQIDKFNLEGKRISTIYKHDTNVKFNAMLMDDSKNIYVVAQSENLIYKLTEK
jgi:hypothetical protein